MVLMLFFYGDKFFIDAANTNNGDKIKVTFNIILPKTPDELKSCNTILTLVTWILPSNKKGSLWAALL